MTDRGGRCGTALSGSVRLGTAWKEHIEFSLVVGQLLVLGVIQQLFNLYARV